jgi:hypothetical protein
MHNIKTTNKQLKNILAGYLYPVFPLTGLLILSGLILAHTLRMGSSLSTTGKILYLCLILIAAIFILVGMLARTKTGVGFQGF